uniref:BTB domain-containing protein n=1 Tax=Pseudo-nitzschia delicatissima TaxID=44447 RepID=A0A7S0YB89_9STRA|mmetsp:Transcript_2018/g.4207  ORF Transcript_2018/g.4207 Transcript_2018/m.4207 type:complete len:366 (+) Transcript_2018:16-1113(+)
MANNNGRQGGGGGGNSNMNEHVEFTVKAEEDLYLTGSENTIRRVTAETNYSCLMLKTQRFSSLFRHYAKYHGLRKDDLEYYFVNPLENEDTPESVQLQRGDTIMVRKRRKPEPPEEAADDDEFVRDMRELLDDEEHMDAIFEVHPIDTTSMNIEEGDEKTENVVKIRAHKCILTARTDYFKSLFRTNASSSDTKSNPVAFRESETCTIKVEPSFSPEHITNMLEFIYTNRIKKIRDIETDDLLSMLHLSDMWLLRDLKRLIEHELIRNHMYVHTVARMYGATEDFNAQRLSRSCIEFIMANLRQVTGNSSFEEEMKNYPHLCIPVLKAAADMIPEGPALKKQRTETYKTSTQTATGSSPVPDSDP